MRAKLYDKRPILFSRQELAETALNAMTDSFTALLSLLMIFLIKTRPTHEQIHPIPLPFLFYRHQHLSTLAIHYHAPNRS